MSESERFFSPAEAIREARDLMETVRLVYSKHIEGEDPKSGIYDVDHPSGAYIHETLTGGFGGPIWAELSRESKEMLLDRAFGLRGGSFMIRQIEGLDYEHVKPLIAAFLDHDGKSDYDRLLDEAAERGKYQSKEPERGGPER